MRRRVAVMKDREPLEGSFLATCSSCTIPDPEGYGSADEYLDVCQSEYDRLADIYEEVRHQGHLMVAYEKEIKNYDQSSSSGSSLSSQSGSSLSLSSQSGSSELGSLTHEDITDALGRIRDSMNRLVRAAGSIGVKISLRSWHDDQRFLM